MLETGTVTLNVPPLCVGVPETVVHEVAPESAAVDSRTNPVAASGQLTMKFAPERVAVSVTEVTTGGV